MTSQLDYFKYITYPYRDLSFIKMKTKGQFERTYDDIQSYYYFNTY